MLLIIFNLFTWSLNACKQRTRFPWRVSSRPVGWGGGASNPVSKRRGPTGVQHIKDISQSIPAAAKCGY